MAGQLSDLGDLCGPQRGRIWHMWDITASGNLSDPRSMSPTLLQQRRYWQPFHDPLRNKKLLFGVSDAKPWPHVYQLQIL